MVKGPNWKATKEEMEWPPQLGWNTQANQEIRTSKSAKRNRGRITNFQHPGLGKDDT